jgi:hypothetical protein
MKEVRRLLFLLIGFLIGSTTVHAQVPQLINLQAALEDGSLPNPITIDFTIYDAATSGNALWTETQSVDHIGGVFNVLLGSVSAFPSSLFNSDGELYLDMLVEGETLQERYLLSSVAYALRAAHADNAGPRLARGNDTRLNFYTNTGSVDSRSWIEMWGQETGNPNFPSRQGELTLAGHHISFWTNSGLESFGTENMRLSEEGNLTVNGSVGIGVSTPTHPLEMASGAHVTAAGVWTNASSRDYKENIRDLTPEAALTTLKALQPVQYNYKVDREDEYVGFIAEDVPSLVATKNRKGLSPMDVVAVLTKVVQQQQAELEALKARLDADR